MDALVPSFVNARAAAVAAAVAVAAVAAAAAAAAFHLVEILTGWF